MKIKPLAKLAGRVLCGAVLVTSIPTVLTGCLMQRTVTDESGTVIYQEPQIHSPFESDAEERADVERKTRQLGW